MSSNAIISATVHMFTASKLERKKKEKEKDDEFINQENKHDLCEMPVLNRDQTW